MLAGWCLCFGLQVAAVKGSASFPSNKELVARPSAWLGELAETTQRKYSLPAVYLAVATENGIEYACAGDRSFSPFIVRKSDPEDRLCIASITKPITATLCLALEERGVLSAKTALGETFPELAGVMSPPAGSLTINDFLMHRSGMAASGPTSVWSMPIPNWAPNYAPAGNPLERYRYLARLLQVEPQTTNHRYVYSSDNYRVVACMVERKATIPFEAAMRQFVFQPFTLASARLGMDGLARIGSSPAYYPFRNGRPGVPFEGTPENDENMALNSCCGNVCMNVMDLARFGWAFVAGLHGAPNGLSEASFRIALTPDPLTPTRTPVWEVVQLPQLGQAFQHTGQMGDERGFWSNSVLVLSPKKKIAVAVMTNRGEAWQGLFSTRDQMLDHFVQK